MRGEAKVLNLEIEQDLLLLDVEFTLDKDEPFVRDMEFTSQPNIEKVITDTLKSKLRRMLQTRVNEASIKESLIEEVIIEDVVDEAGPVELIKA